MINLLLTQPEQFLAWIAALVIAVTIHEFAHAWTAVQLGDPTPKLQDRLTLNPFSHLDPLGTLMLLLIGFGWGRPVQFDPYNLDNPRRDAALISIAGPLSNLLLASILSIILRLGIGYGFIPPFIYLNVILALFNLLPIHPLDGGKILVGLLSDDLADEVDLFLQQYGFILLMLIIFPIFNGTSLVSTILTPLISFFMNIYLPGIAMI